MPRPLSHKWYRNWAPELLGEPDPDGFNIVKMLGPAERWCWECLKAMCASSQFQPAICQQPFVGFTDAQFVEVMDVPFPVWRSCKQKLAFAGKIDVDLNNVIIIRGWERHASKYFRGRMYQDGKLIGMTAEEAERGRALHKTKYDLFVKVIGYLNEKAGKTYRVSNKAAFGHVSARYDEGNRWEDFKHVIDVKVQRWLGDDAMELYLRPETLFNSEKFDSYRQERLIVRKRDVGSVGPPKIMPEERAKYAAQAKVIYEQKKAQIMAEHGVTDEEGWVSLMFKGRAFTFDEFFLAYIKKLRGSAEWSLEPEENKK